MTNEKTIFKSDRNETQKSKKPSKPDGLSPPRKSDPSEEALKEKQKLDNLVQKAGSILFECRAVWPFDFFPNEIIIDKEKLTIITKNFFSSSQTRSILYKNISEVTAECSVFFATLKVTLKTYVDEPFEIPYLKKQNAIKARRILQGLINATEQKIEFTDIEAKELRKKMELVGRSIEPEE